MSAGRTAEPLDRKVDVTSFGDNSWAPREPAGNLPPIDVIFGRTKAMAEIRSRIERVADAAVPVLIRGESGTGKEVIARLIHQRSACKNGPFVKVHCPAIPATLLESELFGYEEGAFTGASRMRHGHFEAAHGGSIFLDEIAELDASLQAKLLHVLQDGRVCPIGSHEGRPVEVRILCATHRNLEEGIQAGSFRKELFYRINVVSLHLPPLRERNEDIAVLAEYFRNVYNVKYNRQAPPVSPRVLERMLKYDWPGNVRELENIVIGYVVLGNEEISWEELRGHRPWDAERERGAAEPLSLRKVAMQAAREAQRKVIRQVLEANHGSRKLAARALNISYRALLYKIKEVGIPPKRNFAPRPPAGGLNVN